MIMASRIVILCISVLLVKLLYLDYWIWPIWTIYDLHLCQFIKFNLSLSTPNPNKCQKYIIIIKHTSLDFTSFWTSAWLCKSCQQVNCQLCFWQNCDSSGRQSALQSDALRLNAPSTSFLVQITTLNSRNGPLLLFPVLNWYWTRAVAHLTHRRWTLIEQWRAI